LSKEHPLILYVGPVECGKLLSAEAEARDCYILLPQDDLEALAMYTLYYPDVCVIDPGITFADEVEYHLRSIDAPLIMVGQSPRLQGAGSPALLDGVAAILRKLPVGSGTHV
jgi:hypothetical protein